MTKILATNEKGIDGGKGFARERGHESRRSPASLETGAPLISRSMNTERQSERIDERSFDDLRRPPVTFDMQIDVNTSRVCHGA